MKEEDIDKIFREGLQDSEAPVFKSDWENFSHLRKQTGYSGWKYFLPALIVLVIVSGTFYLYFSESSENIGAKQTVGEKGNDEKGKMHTEEVSPELSETESAKPNIHADNTLYAEVDSFQYAHPENGKDGKMGGHEQESARFENSNFKMQNQESNVNEDKDNSPREANEKNQKNESVQVKTELRTAENDLSDQNPVRIKNPEKQYDEDRAEAEEVHSYDNESARSSDPKISAKILNVSDASNDKMKVEKTGEIYRTEYAFQLENMVSLPAGALKVLIDKNSFNAEKMPVSMVRNSHQISVYFGVEQNNILGTSPMAGLVSSWHLARWTFGVGIGYQRSGVLNWNQESRRTIYGFDRYEASATLQTRSVNLLSIPIKFSRHMGGSHALFLGVTPSILVNASQELLIFDDRNLTNLVPESGYLYKTQAPEIVYFISGGYTYHLATWWSVDVGFNYSFQNWRPTDKLPVGVFLQTNIKVR